MKKAITILAVLIVLVSAVFADETHKIQIKADVTQIIPVFGLRYGTDDTKITNTATKITDDTDENYLQYEERYGVATAPLTYGYESNAIDVNFNLDKDGSVTVQACLLNPAKQRATYSLEFIDGVFDVTRQGHSENETHEPASITSSALVPQNTDGVSTSLGDAAREGGANNKKINVIFDGKTVTAATSENLPLAQAVYAYTGDETIDLLPSNQYYYADIQLIITGGI